MSLSVTKNFNLKDEIKKRRVAIKLEMAKQMTDAQAEIKRRTFSAGQNVNGGAFKAYADSTKKYKKEKGASLKVNLTDTGDLQAAMQTRVTEDDKGVTGEIYLTNNRKDGLSNSDIVAKLEEGGRKFFDFSKKQLQAINKALDEAFRK